MPLKDYRCLVCDTVIEALVKTVLDPCPTGCPNGCCEGERMEPEPVNRGTAPHFKGEGWAADGYSSKR